MTLRLATGEVAPLGPAADRAKHEAFKLVRQDDTRVDLIEQPECMGKVRELLHTLGHAA
ncbi:hypothetical protein [Phenylobacterium sp.]|uniref:hypothetical protein n=1 Tax=Phenylobacterium sp. TaxID=1871053 RepID=UPI00273631B5|nr:hypothetical protein [Phenylobacterium sp.]MDP3855189.1 hypothetical protein [Phenylobacterium sp.]